MADETISCSPTLDMPPALEGDPLEVAVERRLRDGRLGEASSFTIFRVPAHIRKEDSKLYEPRLVSIGPYYRDRAELRAMEQHKWRYLRHLLRPAAKVPLRALVHAVRSVESRARDCYSEATGGEDDDFAEMLLLDGCFVLEFFFKCHKRDPDAPRDAGWALVLLRSDLLLMENQVPFFVLEALFDAIFCGRTPRENLVKLVLRYLKPSDALLLRQSPFPEARAGPIHHLLHLVHEAFVPRFQPQPVPQAPAPQPVHQVQPVPQAPQPEPQAQLVRQAQPPLPPPAPQQVPPMPPVPPQTRASPPVPRVMIPCVSALRDAGVRFVKKPSPRDMFDITFDAKRGVMQMPYILIDQAQLPLLVNLIAFEQSRRGRTGPGSPLTSYAALMSFLVRTGKDVEELQRREIVDNLLSSDDEAATKFFQPLGACSSLNYDDHLFALLFADITEYHKKSCHRHRAKFMRDYCSNPWSAIALVLAVLAFFFSIFNQTVSVYNLAHPQQPSSSPSTHG